MTLKQKNDIAQQYNKTTRDSDDRHWLMHSARSTKRSWTALTDVTTNHNKCHNYPLHGSYISCISHKLLTFFFLEIFFLLISRFIDMAK